MTRYGEQKFRILIDILLDSGEDCTIIFYTLLVGAQRNNIDKNIMEKAGKFMEKHFSDYMDFVVHYERI